MAASSQVYHAVGKRKTSIARVYLKNGKGDITINERPFTTYFPEYFQLLAKRSLSLINADGKYDIKVKIVGGGISSQAHACMHGIAKVLTLVSDSNRAPLKKAKCLTRDSRVVERKKYGHKKARKSFQFSKR